MVYNQRDESLRIGKQLNFDKNQIELGREDSKTGRYIVSIGDFGIRVTPVSDITYRRQENMKSEAEKYDDYFYAEVSRKELGEMLQKLAFGEIKYPVVKEE